MTNKEWDRVCESQGVFAHDQYGNDKWAEVAHLKKGIGLRIGIEQATLSPQAARSLARMLIRQASRWEASCPKT